MKLDKQQLEIVNTTEKNVVVIAGAGSGKTRVITERIKKLLSDGVAACSIVSITFTNNAAEEMRQRLADVEGIGDAFIGTIHSFANRLFANSGESYQILTSALKMDIMRELIQSQPCVKIDWRRYLYYVDVCKQIEDGKMSEQAINSIFNPSELVEIGQLENTREPSKDHTHNMHTLMKIRNIIDFDELLKLATKYFQKINGNLEYLLVDEFQDIGRLEKEFLFALQAKNNLFVGDDWQAIYGFKGGNVAYFKDLIKNKEWKEYYLTNNYRNSTKIIELANKIIYQISDEVIPKNVQAIKKDSGTVLLNSKYKLEDRLNDIKTSNDLKDWFILVRTNKDLMMLGEKLREMQIPFMTFRSSENTLAEIKEMIDSDCVKLLTVHAAKGLESKNVLLYGNFPVEQPKYLRDMDERKVMYVGCTRAEETLIILN